MSEKDPKWRFCWQQLNTTDVEAAKQFYGELFGWQFSEQEMAGEMYTIFGMSEDAPLGMFQTQPSDAPSPPLWIPYVSVPDVADTVGKATANGGNVLVPTTAIPDAGTFAVLADPDGAVFAIWATANPDQEQPMPTGNNIPVWYELMSPDPAKSASFYNALFGWGHEEFPMPEGDPYNIFKLGEEGIAGFMRIPTMGPGDPPPPMWTIYVNVEDADATFAKAESLGARILFGIMEVPTVGRFAGFMDKAGAVMAFIQPEPMDN